MMTPAPKSFISQHKDMIQVVYGTILACALYFGVTTKIELLAQKHNDDQVMNEFRISALEKKDVSHYEKGLFEKYAVLPKKEDEIKSE